MLSSMERKADSVQVWNISIDLGWYELKFQTMPWIIIILFQFYF